MFENKWLKFAKEYGLNYRNDDAYFSIIDGIYKSKELEIKIVGPFSADQSGDIAIYDGVNIGNHLGASFNPKKVINMIEKYRRFGPEGFKSYKFKYQVINNSILVFVGLVAFIVLYFLIQQYK